MMQETMLIHTLLGAICGLVIAAALYRARQFVLIASVVMATLVVYTVTDAGVPELERRIAAVITYLGKHADFFRGLLIGKGLFVLVAAGFHAGKRSRPAQ